jgi:hypothetical protein
METEEYVSDPQLIIYAIFMASILMSSGDRNDEFGLGLQNNMLYDVVAADAGPGTTTVNTHTMNVTCGTSSNMFWREGNLSDGRALWASERSLRSITETGA